MLKAALVLLSLGTPAACSDMCSNTVVRVVKATGGQHAVALFQRDCGATTGFSTQVSVLTPGQKVTGGGNAFRADDNHGKQQSAHGRVRGQKCSGSHQTIFSSAMPQGRASSDGPLKWRASELLIEKQRGNVCFGWKADISLSTSGRTY